MWHFRKGTILKRQLRASGRNIFTLILTACLVSQSTLLASDKHKVSPVTEALMDVQFGGPLSHSKVGFAATGLSASDFWNFYNCADPFGQRLTFGVSSDLKFVDGTVSSA